MDDGARLLPQCFVRHRHDGGIHHGRMFVENILHLDTIDVLAAADQHVFRAVDDEAEAFLIDAGEIAGLDPAIDEGCRRRFRLVPVAFDDIGPARPQFAHRIGRQLLPAIRRHDLDIAHRHRRPAGFRAMLIILCRMGGAGGRGFGHAPAITRQGFRKSLLDPAHQFGRRRRPAIGHRFQRGEIVFRACRMFDQLPGNGRHTACAVDLFPLDQLHRGFGVPFAHHHQLGTGKKAWAQNGETARGVEKRHRQKRRALRQIGVRRRYGFPAAEEIARRRRRRCHDVGEHVAMAAERAFGPPRGARSIKDGRVVIRCQRYRGHWLVRQTAPVIDIAQHRFQRGDEGVGHLLIRIAGHEHPLQRRAIDQMG